MFGLEVLSAETSLSILNMTSKVPKFQVVGLLSEKSFTLTLHSSNARGQSEKVILRAETTKPATVTQTDINQAKIGSLKTRLIISPVLGVLIGVGGAIILVSIILFSIMCCRVKYEKISRTLMRRGETAAASDCGNSDKDFQEDLYVDLTGNSPDLIPAEAGSHNKIQKQELLVKIQFQSFNVPWSLSYQDYPHHETLRTSQLYPIIIILRDQQTMKQSSSSTATLTP